MQFITSTVIKAFFLGQFQQDGQLRSCRSRSLCRLRVVPIFPQRKKSERNADAQFSLSPPRLTSLAWGDFHARLRFARSTIHEENGNYSYSRVYEVYDPSDAKELSARLLVDDNFPRSWRKYLKTGAGLIGSCSEYQLLHLLTCGVHSTAHAF